jgi:hypothetical protein
MVISQSAEIEYFAGHHEHQPMIGAALCVATGVKLVGVLEEMILRGTASARSPALRLLGWLKGPEAS